MATAVTRKGQVTIPKAVRDRAGLHPGTMVDVSVGDGGAVVRIAAPSDAERDARIADMRARIAAFRARWKPIDLGMTTDEFMATIREPLP